MATQAKWQSADERRNGSRNGAKERLASSLGWFSIGLGVAEVVLPGKLAQVLGISSKDANRNLLRAYGLREIAAGIGILSQPQAAGWVWGRVAGDVVDLASLGSALASNETNRTRLGTATAAVLGVTALDVFCAQQLSRSSSGAMSADDGTRRITKTTVINRSAEDLYAFWRDFNNLASFMDHVESVEITGENRSHWKVKAPAGRTVEWDAVIVDDQPNSRIAWQSLENSDVNHSGSVQFERAPGGRGTIVKVQLQYDPPAGVVGAAIAKLFGEEPGQQIDHDLRAFKQVMETGEIAKSDASIHQGMHPAQPASGRAATA